MEQIVDIRLKSIMTNWPQGTIFLSSELNKMGIGNDLIRRYKNSGWVESIGQGALIKKGDSVSWEGAIQTLQKQGELNIHIGAMTALNIHGLSHYLNFSQKPIQIYGGQGTRLPKWFANYKWEAKLEYIRNSLFKDNEELGIKEYEANSFNIKMSSPERAFLELLHLVPRKASFKEAELISESLTTLRSSMVQKLLENCNSVKAKRLFLYLNEKQNHQWFKKLNLSKVDLGKGDRQIIKGGMLDKKYKITVPKDTNEGY